ncbi:MAG TPA: thiosulfate oxidation carrier complex protein SoxZ [Burkholderiales bacterium]|nr:thiosulfate oxidation carrier complex protein SoxZ [Burkholderiales bacterium]
MSRIGKPRVRVPESAKRGEVFEIRTMVEHPMESGFRYNNIGQLVPRHIVETFTCTYNGREIFRARLHPAVSTNPYFLFHTVATESGELVFTWSDDQGGVATISARIEVS